jgi:sugar lactone lactonase YvrE
MTIGVQGMEVGQFEEPVGIAVDAQDNLYVADTWNQRVQVFSTSDAGQTYQPVLQWDVAGWFSTSLDNKPYIAVDGQGHVFITDPEAFRVIEFDTNGQFIHTWGDYGTDLGSLGLASGVGVDGQGRVWVSDPSNNRLLRFTLP